MNNSLVQEHFEELAGEYPNLQLVRGETGTWALEGLIDRDVYRNIPLTLVFNIHIRIPEQYPDPHYPLKVFETGGDIPKTADNHVYSNGDGSLCLAAPISVKMKFAEQSTLLGFINGLVIPFLYSFRYKQKYGEMPFGERSHGVDGILEHYKEYFGISSDVVLLGLLRILADDDYRGHQDCPCGSRIRLRNCHGNALLEIKKYHSQEDLLNEYGEIMVKLHESGKKLPISTRSKVLAKLLKKKG